MTKKQCSTCKRMLDHSEFYGNKDHKDGLQYQCKECDSKYQEERNIILKRGAINAFGGQCVHVENGIQCPKNSIDNLRDLDLIHPNGDGNGHRDLISNGKGSSPFYKALKDLNYDTDGFVVEVMCRSHHRQLDISGKRHPMYGKHGKSNPGYKEGKFNDPAWLKKKYATMSLKKIADECGVGCTVIRNRMIEFGHPRRKPWTRP